MKLYALITLVCIILVTQPANTPPRSESPTIPPLSSSQIQKSQNSIVIAMIDGFQQGTLKFGTAFKGFRFDLGDKEVALPVENGCKIFTKIQQNISAIIGSSKQKHEVEKAFFATLPHKDDLMSEENQVIHSLFELQQFVNSKETPIEYALFFQKMAQAPLTSNSSKNDIEAFFNDVKKLYQDALKKQVKEMPPLQKRYLQFCERYRAHLAQPDITYSPVCPSSCDML